MPYRNCSDSFSPSDSSSVQHWPLMSCGPTRCEQAWKSNLSQSVLLSSGILCHISLFSSPPPAPSPIQASKRCFTQTLKGRDGDTLFTLQKTGYCVNSALRGDIEMTVKRDVLIKISGFFNGKKNNRVFCQRQRSLKPRSCCYPTSQCQI